MIHPAGFCSMKADPITRAAVTSGRADTYFFKGKGECILSRFGFSLKDEVFVFFNNVDIQCKG
jgi:hypothetical protein